MRENQQKVADLLRQLAESHATMVRVTADWLLLGPADLQKLIKPPAGPDKREGAIQEIDPAALRNLPDKTRHFHAETLSFSGQTVHVVSGRVRSVVTTVMPVVGTDVVAYQPEVTGMGAGIALQVTPRLDSDRQSAVVTLYSTFNDPEDSGNLTPLMVQGLRAHDPARRPRRPGNGVVPAAQHRPPGNAERPSGSRSPPPSSSAE